MTIDTEPYYQQLRQWPAAGQHILASYDDHSIVVYQAYRASIARHALEHGFLGGPDFSFSRMSWIKPNFLWMMYRSAWGTQPGQEYVLGLRIRRAFFDGLLRAAVPSSFAAAGFATVQDWQAAVQASEVRLQWDPDHAPSGAKCERRAVQLGLRGQALCALATEQLLEVIDMSPFVAEQRLYALDDSLALLTPRERVYEPVEA